ncbi:acyltransferase [Marinobacter sp. JSM 1782161]|uniref:acyltransferase n=1 Tax=Marinobacter sp. JSM 1782161 TaxID=2685906 RepID=UPI00140264C7|nr:acyltransferase family protein [Marinobacter sp. JSM 1782161]
MQHKVWIDYLRVIAIVAVIAIHVSTVFYKQLGEISGFDWWFANLLDSASRFSVPLFVMASGAVLLGREISPGTFLQKRAWRLLPPLILWNLVYLVAGYFLWNPDQRSLLDMTLTMVRAGHAYGHLWYLTMFTCLMLFAPFVNQYLRGEAPRGVDLLWLAGLFVLFALMTQGAVLVRYVADSEIKWFAVFPLYLLYFVGGYALDRYDDRLRCPAAVLVGIVVATVLVGALGNWLLFRHTGLDEDFLVLSNRGLLVIACTFAIFRLLRQNAHRLKPRASISAWSDASFGIYLIHPLIIFATLPLSRYFDGMLALFMVLDVAAVALVSFLIVRLMRRFAWFRRVS